MYVGRFVVLGRTLSGDPYLGYRVSSRSFPNRTILTTPDRAMVVPTSDAPPSNNPYISYNCLRIHGDVVVVANGSHVDPIIDKVGLGYGLRDAMALALLALDYEHDQYNTPRIAAGWDLARKQGFMGIVGEGQLAVCRIEVPSGQAYLLATYERTEPTPIALQGETAQALCDALFASEYEHPVAALAVLFANGELHMATRTREGS
ncbi:MAG: IMP cyclohydrolase [Chloroflexi bacterium]|nr:IMP cyclohydrolase [Chloroflexota bacterium]